MQEKTLGKLVSKGVTRPILESAVAHCRVLDWRPSGQGFEPHQRHCVVVLQQDTFILA